MAQKSRVDFDPNAAQGIGWPYHIALRSAAPTASGTNFDQWFAPISLTSPGKGFPVVRIAEAFVRIESLNSATSGANIFLLNVVDAAGNLLRTLATLSPAYNVRYQNFDLRDGKGIGLPIYAGERLRLDTGTLASGGSPTGVGIAITAEAYGISA